MGLQNNTRGYLKSLLFYFNSFTLAALKFVNMKQLYLFTFVFVLFFNLNAQDYIVVNGSDTIHCKINEISSSSIFFTITQNNVPLKSSMPLTKVSSYYFNTSQATSNDQIIISRTEPEEKYVNKNEDLLKGKELIQRFRIAADAGYGRFTAPTNPNNPDFLKDYYNDLKSGTHFALGVNYFTRKKWGFGLKYSLFKTANEFENIVLFYPDGTYDQGLLRDDITVNYIGASILYRFLGKNKVSGLYIEVSVGKTFYQNNSVLVYNYNMKGNRMSFGYGIGYDFKVTSYLAIGVGYDMYVASLDRLVVNNKTYFLSKPEDKENISRINLTCGLRFLLQ